MLNTTVIINDGSKAIKRMRSALVIVMTVFLAACSTNDNADLHARLNSIKAKPAGKIPSLPVFVPYETFMYGAQNEDDPFKGLTSVVVEEKVVEIPVDSPLRGRNIETLEQYPLDTLRYVGQLTKDGDEWAIITSPDLIVHRVKVGDHLGTNYGEILEIHETEIKISETIPDEIGGWIKREAALSLME